MNQILIVLFILLLTKTEAAWNSRHVEIINDLGPNTCLTIHCKSKDDDLGVHLLHFQETYWINFKINIFGGTLFFCSFQWPDNFHHLDVYNQERDNVPPKECRTCRYMIRSDGGHRYNEEFQDFTDFFKWNEK
ncbi:putative plant self-incompatibility S1 [Rosa chinensis]|uniref:S-protein homolog n=1 Tax=Rosa chinensis TaxID=74649 RepID=A0A2P6QRZ0_ROSCH|nr:putative plant self-incompatibility S1 [Rosa chinensis]